MAPRPDRRSEILAAASRLFARSGYHGVSIDDLGAELGISGPAIYRYFAGKEALLAEMLTDISRRLLDGARVRIASESDPQAQLAALVDFHTDFALTEPELIAVQFRDLGSLPDRERRLVRSLQRQYVGLWVDVLGRVHPGVDPEEARTAAQAVFGLMNSTPYTSRADQPRLREQMQAMATAALAAGCRTP